MGENLTQGEKRALKDLKQNKDLFVRKADKGGVIIVLNGGLYRKLNLEMLSDTNNFAPLRHYFPDEIKHTIGGGCG